MAQYRYYVADLITSAITAELPLYGVYFDKRLNQSGNFTGTYKLNTGVDNDQYLLDATIPGKYAVYVERNGVTIWGGPIWTRTYQSGSESIQLTAQTFESVFDHIRMTADHIYTTYTQEYAFLLWFLAVEAQTGCDLDITFNLTAEDSVIRNISFPANENHMASDMINMLTSMSDGLDVTMNVTSPSNKRFTVTSRNISVDSGAYFDYPGSISKYWWNESALRGAKTFVATGKGITASAAATLTGYPNFTIIESNAEVIDSTVLQARADQLAAERAMPYASPTFELGNSDDFTLWDKCGQTITMNVLDARFPLGKTLVARMLGWSLSPESSDSTDTLRFVLETDE